MCDVYVWVCVRIHDGQKWNKDSKEGTASEQIKGTRVYREKKSTKCEAEKR